MSAKPRLIVLSPHLDDGILSCGGLMAALRGKIRIEDWTIFSAAPLRGPYSHSAQWLHGASGGYSGARLARMRRNEDRAACRTLGVVPRYLRWMDAAYRVGISGKFLYRACLRDDWHPDDEVMINEMKTAFTKELSASDIVLVPIGIGGHVDHLIVRHAAESSAARLLYYPDLPYVATRLDESQVETAGLWRARYRPSAVHVEQWNLAIRSYATQIPLLEESVGSLSLLTQSLADAEELSLFSRRNDLPAELQKSGVFREPEFCHELTSVKIARRTPGRGVRAEVVEIPDWSASPLAPIAVFAYKRLDLLKQTLKALERCDGFTESPKHIFSDAAPAGDQAGQAAVLAVRRYLRRWCAQHDATLHEADANQGLRASIVAGVTKIVGQYGHIIVLEDDMLVSNAFLVFMNQALDAYRDREDVVQVSGYNVPHANRLNQIGLLRVPSSWGWATWQRAWSHYRDDPLELLHEVRQRDTNTFDIDGTYGNLEALENNAVGSLNTWAVRWYASVFLRGGMTVYPGMSFVRNIGFGDDGTNCKPGPMASAFTKQRIRRRRISPDWNAIGEAEDAAFASTLVDFYRWQQHQWTKPTNRERLTAWMDRLIWRRVSDAG